MKTLKDRTIQQWDDFIISFEVTGTEKPLALCIKDDKEELFHTPMEKNWSVYATIVDEDVISSLDKGDYTYSVRIQEKPKTTVAKGKLTIE